MNPKLIFRLALLAVFCTWCTTAVYAQTRVINGTVTDKATGLPLANATVVIKGTNRALLVGADGSFTINEARPGMVVTVSYSGYASQDVTIKDQTELSIALSSVASNLDDVVVIGYGTVKKRDLTGAVVSVKSAEITARPGPNPMESLQGRVAGLDITRSSGQAGAGVNMQLRGNRSFTASGTPLFIIDGLPGDYATLNSYDIESIEILKDASSTAVYGSAGSNGVIIITTKKVRPEK